LTENIKSVILSNCKKESVRRRYTSEKKPSQNYIDNDFVTSKPSSSKDSKSYENNYVNLGPLVQTVLDLFPDQEKDFIEVKSN
jgi:hypothetical protein